MKNRDYVEIDGDKHDVDVIVSKIMDELEDAKEGDEVMLCIKDKDTGETAIGIFRVRIDGMDKMDLEFVREEKIQ